MVKKEAGAIIVALLLVATLGAGVANAIVLGGGHNVSMVVIGNSTFDDFFSNDLLDEIEEEKEEEEEETKGVDVGNASLDWLGGNGTDWPFGYWDITSEAWKKTFPSYHIPGYWDTNWGFEWP
ncbi:MAG: hypothetical protein WBE22_09435 [Halobacteriota archaeon]